MKTLIIVFSLSIILFSCRQQSVEKPVFTKIDLSWGNGWTKIISVSIDSTKNVKIAMEELNKRTTYFSGQLIDSSFIKINKLVDSSLTQDFKNKIGYPIPDGGISYLIIKTKNKNIESMIFETGIEKKLDTLISTLIELKNYNLSKTTDSTFYFESLIKIHPPKPIMDTVTFIPPVIKDDVMEK